MTSKPPQQSQTQISQIMTQAVKTIQAKVNFGAVALKKGVKVPELWIENSEGGRPTVYPLLGDRYLVGRSSKSCDITIRNPVVSQIHFSLERDTNNPRCFIIKDENSTNGIYTGKRRLKTFPLTHGDKITLGPPELQGAVQIKYHNPAPVWARAILYSLYGTGGILGLLTLWIGFEWSKIPVRPLPLGFSGPVVIYAGDGKTPLSPLSNDTHKELKNLSDFSPHLPNAVIASEDSRYYWHLGVDPIGVLRAITINRQGQGIRQGASTLTQQVARSLFSQVGRENTLARKLREMLVSLKLEAFYSKDELLKVYLNRVYLGAGNYGFEDAAQFYFDKSATELNVAEAATLVATLPAPNSYNPVHDYQTTIQFRNRVINRMAKLGMISEEEAARARRSRIEVSSKATQSLTNTIAPYYYSYVFKELRNLLGEDLAKEGNFIVETGLDVNIQKKAETSLRAKVSRDGSSYRFSQGAMVTLNAHTGQILALTGGVDYQTSQFDRATQAHRQPGSTFKAFVYAAALDQGISPNKFYSCAGLVWKGQKYRPCEHGGGGEIDMYTAIALSENAVALRIAQDAGLQNVVSMAQRLGIKSKLNPVPGLVLGQSEVNVLEMTGAYAAIANRGIWNRPHAITRILDSSDCADFDNPQTCREIYSFQSDRDARKQVLTTQVADTMTALMRGVIERGTARSAALGLDEAGKTGTTNKGVDLWFIGFIPSRHIVTGVWLGNDDNSPTSSSSAQAAALWHDYMKQVVGQ